MQQFHSIQHGVSPATWLYRSFITSLDIKDQASALSMLSSSCTTSPW